MKTKMNRRILQITILTALFLAVGLTLGARCAGAAGPSGPGIVVHITENVAVGDKHPNTAERVVVPELELRGYRAQAASAATEESGVFPARVSSVWNADSRVAFREHFDTDLLWIGEVTYKFNEGPRGEVNGTVSAVAAVMRADTGKPIWSGSVSSWELKGPTLEAAARKALGSVHQALVKDFASAVKAPGAGGAAQPGRVGPPTEAELFPVPGSERPIQTPGPTPPVVPPSLGPESDPDEKSPYTGIEIDAEHLPVQPSFRTEFYSPRGQPMPMPRGRINWLPTDRREHVGEYVGSRPYRVKALEAQGNRIVIPESARRAARSSLPTTVIVRPPNRPPSPAAPRSGRPTSGRAPYRR